MFALVGWKGNSFTVFCTFPLLVEREAISPDLFSHFSRGALNGREDASSRPAAGGDAASFAGGAGRGGSSSWGLLGVLCVRLAESTWILSVLFPCHGLRAERF